MDGPHRLLGGVVRSESSLDEHAGRRRAAPFKIVLHDDLPWLRLGGAYFLMAAVCSLPMVGRGLIINTHLRLRPDISTAFYMATWLPSLAAPIVGRLTDLLPPSRRKIAAAALVARRAHAWRRARACRASPPRCSSRQRPAPCPPRRSASRSKN